MANGGCCSFTLMLLFLITGIAVADDHIVIERVRTAMGMRSPARSMEVWISETATAIQSGQLVTVKRYDLKKRWIISVQTKRYFEDTLATVAEETKEPVAIQRAGWDYDPVYDWSISEPGTSDSVRGYTCVLIKAVGDADYSSQAIELWVSGSVPINIERFNERISSTSPDIPWDVLVAKHPSLRKLFVMKSKAAEAPAIAPERTYETTVTKLESVPPPPGVYEIPEGFQRVNSSDELTR